MSQKPTITIQIGARYGRMTVIAKESTYKWTCQCADCNEISTYTSATIRAGKFARHHCGEKQTFIWREGKPYIMVDRRFGDWTVKKFDKKNSVPSRPYWLCECRCGETLPVAQHSLLSGMSLSCGCGRLTAKVVPKQMPTVSIEQAQKDYLGKTFGLLTIIDIEEVKHHHDALFFTSTRCGCKKQTLIRSNLSRITHGLITSCGCISGKTIIFGKNKSEIPIIYAHIINQVCKNPEQFPDRNIRLRYLMRHEFINPNLKLTTKGFELLSQTLPTIWNT